MEGIDREALTTLITQEVAKAVASHEDRCPAVAAVEELKKGQDETHHLLNKLQMKLNGIWANGSGGPPGWLETFSARTEARFDTLETKVTELRVSKIESDGAKKQLDRIEAKETQFATAKRDWAKLLLQAIAILGGGSWAAERIRDFILNHH